MLVKSGFHWGCLSIAGPIAPPLPSLPPTTFLTVPGRFLICLSASPTPVSIPQLAQRPQEPVLSPLFLLSMEGGGLTEGQAVSRLPLKATCPCTRLASRSPCFRCLGLNCLFWGWGTGAPAPGDWVLFCSRTVRQLLLYITPESRSQPGGWRQGGGGRAPGTTFCGF